MCDETICVHNPGGGRGGGRGRGRGVLYHDPSDVQFVRSLKGHEDVVTAAFLDSANNQVPFFKCFVTSASCMHVLTTLSALPNCREQRHSCARYIIQYLKFCIAATMDLIGQSWTNRCFNQAWCIVAGVLWIEGLHRQGVESV